MRIFRCFIAVGFVTLLFTSCLMQKAVLTDPAETYIKTRVERHDSAEFSSVKIFPMLPITATNNSTEIQFTAYKYGGEKSLVVCIRPFHLSGTNKVYDSTEVVELNEREAQGIIDNYRRIEDKILLEKPLPGEFVYHDYTVNENVFISYRGTLNPVLRKVVSSVTIDLWVNSVKYTVPSNELLEKMQSFLSY